MPKKKVEKKEKKKDELEKKESVVNNFNILNIGLSYQKEEELLNKLQIEISEYTNYDNIQNPYNFKSWWDTLSSSKEAPFSIRKKIYQISLHYLPGSYKLWYHYLQEERDNVKKNYRLPNVNYDKVNQIHEQSLLYMLKMPVIWISYIQFLMEQNLVTKTRLIIYKY